MRSPAWIAWPPSWWSCVATRTIDMHIARLREKLADDPNAPSFVSTVRGKGYMLATGAEIAT